MNIPLSYGDYKGQSGALNASEMVNMMVQPDQQGGKVQYGVVGTPGCKVFADTGEEAAGRGGYPHKNTIYTVTGNKVYAVNTTSKTYEQIGTVSTVSGLVRWVENPEQIAFIDDSGGYVITKADNTFEQITDEDFPTPLSITFKDGYGVVVEKDTGKQYVSAINDFTSWGALSFATAEYEPDNLVGNIASSDSLFAFGEKTVQVYYNSGNSTFPFDPRPGANLEIGCGATHSIARGENIVFWLDNHGVVRQIAGFQQSVISTDQVEFRIAQLTDFSDATGFFYSQEGHSFYVLMFPNAGVTEVYDITTGLWHKRSSGANNGRWRPAWIAQAGQTVLAGDYNNGKIYELDTGTYTDNGDHLRWFFTLQDINSGQQKIAHDMLELKIESGVGLVSNSDPQFWLIYSDDNGKTWSREKWRSMGKIGEYSKRARFYNLGLSRSRTYKVGGADPVKRVIASARLEGRVVAS